MSRIAEDYKEKWQRFYEQACEEHPNDNFAQNSARADEMLADENARLIDEAYDRQRDEEAMKELDS